MHTWKKNMLSANATTYIFYMLYDGFCYKIHTNSCYSSIQHARHIFWENIFTKEDWYLLSHGHLSLKLFCPSVHGCVPRNYTFLIYMTLHNKEDLYNKNYGFQPRLKEFLCGATTDFYLQQRASISFDGEKMVDSFTDSFIRIWNVSEFRFLVKNNKKSRYQCLQC